ncbi:MAG: ATP-binding protein [Clostridia bacterium]|nr:ATP-binding protein [Clostridia bacterium]MCI9275225.1 ATP-binding protein [Clostridia bacterium]
MSKNTIYREEYMKKLRNYKDKNIIKVLTGIRRSGKSTILNEFRKELINDGILEKNIISINFEDNSNKELLDYQKLHDFIIDNTEKNTKNYIFLDEIQNVLDFEKCINSLFLREYLDIYITGSNSYMLSGELATFLTGRYIQIHVLPLSFREYLTFYGENDELKKYNEYIKYGGFPYLINLDTSNEKIQYLDSIYNTVIIKDVINRKKVNDVLVLESICRFLFDNIGSNVSTKKISDTLSSGGRKNSVHTIEEYLNALLESYILYKVHRFDIKGKQLLKTQEKYYLSDLGLRTYLLGQNHNKDLGHILENVIFLELKRRDYRIFVGKNETNEVDFVIDTGDDYIYVQVALSVRDEETLKRELKPLATIPDHFRKYIITLDYDINNYNGIKQISALDFLLRRCEL